MRDIKADMQAALIHEYQGYVRAGREVDAEQVAAVLKSDYGYDVVKPDGEAKKASAPETKAVPRPPEAAIEPKPEPASAAAKPGSADADEKPAAAKKTAAKRTPAKPESK